METTTATATATAGSRTSWHRQYKIGGNRIKAQLRGADVESTRVASSREGTRSLKRATRTWRRPHCQTFFSYRYHIALKTPNRRTSSNLAQSLYCCEAQQDEVLEADLRNCALVLLLSCIPDATKSSKGLLDDKRSFVIEWESLHHFFRHATAKRSAEHNARSND